MKDKIKSNSFKIYKVLARQIFAKIIHFQKTFQGEIRLIIFKDRFNSYSNKIIYYLSKIQLIMRIAN